MGVPGLWDLIIEAGQTTTLRHLAEEALEEGKQLKVGVDVSLWLTQVQTSVGGLNYPNMPAQTFFDKIAKFYNFGYRLVFVFDGPNRPRHKRDKFVGGSALPYEQLAKRIIEAFGFEWIRAPGEAEAELARLNADGIIDYVCTDDADTFVFGGVKILRNHSLKLSGSKGLEDKIHKKKSAKAKGTDEEGEDEDFQVGQDQVRVSGDSPCVTFDMANITAKTGLDRNGMLLIAIMSGGDYDTTGVERAGTVISAGLAQCGFGERLVAAYTDRNMPKEHLMEFVAAWRAMLIEEIKTDSQKTIGRRYKSVADKITSAFPNLRIIDSYLNPITAINDEQNATICSKAGPGSLNIKHMIYIMHETFEWPHRRILLRFFNCILMGILIQACRQKEQLTPAFCPFEIDFQDLQCRVRDVKNNKKGQTEYYRLEINAPDSLMVSMYSCLIEPSHAAAVQAEADDKSPRKGKDKLQEPWREWVYAPLFKKALKKPIEAYLDKEQEKADILARREERKQMKLSQQTQSSSSLHYFSSPEKIPVKRKEKGKAKAESSNGSETVGISKKNSGVEMSKDKSMKRTKTGTTIDDEPRKKYIIAPKVISKKARKLSPSPPALIQENDVFTSPRSNDSNRFLPARGNPPVDLTSSEGKVNTFSSQIINLDSSPTPPRKKKFFSSQTCEPTTSPPRRRKSPESDIEFENKNRRGPTKRGKSGCSAVQANGKQQIVDISSDINDMPVLKSQASLVAAASRILVIDDSDDD